MYCAVTALTGQLKLQDVMKNKLPRSGNRGTAITKSIGVFIAKDMRPYSVVQNEGFKQMHFSEVVIPKLYLEVK